VLEVLGRRLSREALIDILAAALAIAATAARAEPPPACGGGQAGVPACIAGRLCSCGFVRGGSMTGLTDGYRWDCGIERPPCADALPPATIDAYQGSLPDSVDIDRSTTVIQQGGAAPRPRPHGPYGKSGG
jgi:hypothetical protein